MSFLLDKVLQTLSISQPEQSSCESIFEQACVMRSHGIAWSLTEISFAKPVLTNLFSVSMTSSCILEMPRRFAMSKTSSLNCSCTRYTCYSSHHQYASLHIGPGRVSLLFPTLMKAYAEISSLFLLRQSIRPDLWHTIRLTFHYELPAWQTIDHKRHQRQAGWCNLIAVLLVLKHSDAWGYWLVGLSTANKPERAWQSRLLGRHCFDLDWCWHGHQSGAPPWSCPRPLETWQWCQPGLPAPNCTVYLKPAYVLSRRQHDGLSEGGIVSYSFSFFLLPIHPRLLADFDRVPRK